MGIQALLIQFKPYAQDIKNNLKSIFVDYEIKDLSKEEVWFIGLVVSYTLRNPQLTDYFETYVLENLKDKNIKEHIDSIKSLITVMTVKNTYHKAIFKSKDLDLNRYELIISEEILKLHKRINNQQFQKYALACAAVSASRICMQEQITELRNLEVSTAAIHSIISIAAVLKGASQALYMN